MIATITETVTLVTEQCCKCSVVFALPSSLIRNLRETQDAFYCPNGHPQSYIKSEASNLREQLTIKENELRAAKCEILNEQNRRLIVEKEKVRAERKLKRVNKGVCPCCNRTFGNLARHMATKHAEVVTSK